jgi:SEL1 protein
VPKSCQAAVLYYNQPAEKVVDLVQVPGLSPNVEKVRLTTDEEGGASARRERDVVQYYQYSADMGNADAATAIGQLLNYGARGMTQDHRRAYRYFTQAAALNPKP